MKKVTAVLLGAGQRGNTYSNYSKYHPDELQMVAVAEPDDERRKRYREKYGIDEEMCFKSWDELLAQPKLADAAIICTQDRMHFKPAMKAMELGYHVLLEKPMSPDPEECVLLRDCAKKHNRILSICHVLRYTKFFTKIKELLDEGRIGRLISIQHNENVGYWHQAHSFVRGNWRNSAETSPMILAKSCHDMDILLWLAGGNCVNVASFGHLTHFKKENAPEGAPLRCTDGCPVEKDCPYSAIKAYLGENTGWPVDVITSDLSLEGRRKALEEGPYGRCVYHCDNDVVDHQVVCLEFDNEVTAAFTMCAFNTGSRTIKLMGTLGEIRGHMEKNEIELISFIDDSREIIPMDKTKSGHGGGDYGIMYDFVRLLQTDGAKEGRTSAAISVQSHLIAFAAEESRISRQVVNIEEFEKSVMKKQG